MQNQKRAKRKVNALRNAQLQGVSLLLWQKFGFGRTLFKRYYQAQRIFSAKEWPILEETLDRELPVTFRMHGYHPRRNTLLRQLQNFNVEPLPWMQNSTAFLVPDAARKGSSNTALGKWLIRAVNAGVAARQVFCRLHRSISSQL
jgi:hypothetical protein